MTVSSFAAPRAGRGGDLCQRVVVDVVHLVDELGLPLPFAAGLPRPGGGMRLGEAVPRRGDPGPAVLPPGCPAGTPSTERRWQIAVDAPHAASVLLPRGRPVPRVARPLPERRRKGPAACAGSPPRRGGVEGGKPAVEPQQASIRLSQDRGPRQRAGLQPRAERPFDRRLGAQGIWAGTGRAALSSPWLTLPLRNPGVAARMPGVQFPPASLVQSGGQCQPREAERGRSRVGIGWFRQPSVTGLEPALVRVRKSVPVSLGHRIGNRP